METGQEASQLALPLPLSACQLPGTPATLDSAARGRRGTATMCFGILLLVITRVKSWCVSMQRRHWKV